MSDNVRSYGFIARLVNSVDHEEVDEKLYDAKSNLSVNYDGTMVYSDLNRHQPYRVREDIYGLFIGDEKALDIQAFFAECQLHGLVVDVPSAKPYNCIWYNGSDSPMSCLTQEEFALK